ncbi:trimeric intracellular cation channel family protein [Erythrobacter sp. LQ02-29]|uniref:trimeric intracellular cation channel family protein n=1 Tax=unclassified Erythrobacter TaxID=2633097 RepID=UPI001BFBFDA3|nr:MULTISPECIES: trimeric intracellular cation channel family protein [unclassified Erythrobacter]MCP9222886.1 trimeric intracellular cation channel family protein [Erythrobacter sp. LQ02-29]QWC55911.1 trimeric intracellular cation channel family protein [Erythrobacter sp. 3-20A1M]
MPDAQTILTPLLDWLDLAGVAVFALSGALIAARERQTFVTLSFFSLVTGVGGGTIRDLLIGAPVFWIHDPWVAAVTLIVALAVWFTPTRIWTGHLLDYADGLGLTAYAVLGTAKAMTYGVPPVPAAMMGVVTGCVGGIIRDVVAGRPSILMKPELYVTASALSATLCAIGTELNIARGFTWTGATAAGYALRSAAIRFNLALPAYHERAAATAEEENQSP